MAVVFLDSIEDEFEVDFSGTRGTGFFPGLARSWFVCFCGRDGLRADPTFLWSAGVVPERRASSTTDLDAGSTHGVNMQNAERSKYRCARFEADRRSLNALCEKLRNSLERIVIDRVRQYEAEPGPSVGGGQTNTA